jgi:acyl-CoA dehydrogenase
LSGFGCRKQTTSLSTELDDIRSAVGRLCADFPGEYWRELDRERAYPEAFVRTLSDAGYLGALIPEEYGGSGLGVTEACAVLEAIHAAGCNAAACHAQMYTMGTLLRHGSEEQKRRYLPDIAAGRVRLQAFGVTEPTSGTDTTSIRTTAVRQGSDYVVNGQKVFISRTEYSDLMLLLVRTTAREEAAKRTAGLSVLIVDLRDSVGNGLTIRPLRTMMNHASTELFIDDLTVPAENLIGEEGQGFSYILDGMNAERILIAAECIGDGRWFVERASRYSTERILFDRPIGENQGIQFPIARVYADLEAAALMVERAARLFDADRDCAAQANMAKLLAADAASKAGDVCIQTYGGYGFAEEYDVERKFRETRLYQVAPVSTNMILSYIATKVLGMPRSF